MLLYNIIGVQEPVNVEKMNEVYHISCQEGTINNNSRHLLFYSISPKVGYGTWFPDEFFRVVSHLGYTNEVIGYLSQDSHLIAPPLIPGYLGSRDELKSIDVLFTCMSNGVDGMM